MSAVDSEDVRNSIITGIVSIVALGALLWLLGFDVTLEQAFWVLVAFISLGFVTRRTSDISVGFVIISIGVIFLLSDFVLPTWVTEPFTPITVLIRATIGIDLAAIDAIGYTVLAVTFVGLAIAVRTRLTGEAKTFRPIIDRVFREFLRYLNVYLNTARLLVLFAIGAIAIVLQQMGMLSGQVGTIVQEVPFIAANVMTAVAGYLSLGGELPIIGSIPLLDSLGPASWVVFVILLLGAAAAVRFRASGPLSQAIDQLLGR